MRQTMRGVLYIVPCFFSVSRIRYRSICLYSFSCAYIRGDVGASVLECYSYPWKKIPLFQYL